MLFLPSSSSFSFILMAVPPCCALIAFRPVPPRLSWRRNQIYTAAVPARSRQTHRKSIRSRPDTPILHTASHAPRSRPLPDSSNRYGRSADPGFYMPGSESLLLSWPCSLFLKLSLDHPIQIPARICNKILPFGQWMELLMLHVQIPQFLIPGAPQQRAAVSRRGCSTARSGSAPCSSKKWIMGTSF